MRFIPDGPSIPDELLLARDQGRVVFFCGAGVSRAKAKLPDFFELAEKVTKTLGLSSDNPAVKIIDEAKKIGKRTGVDGLISADRIFGLLERDFLTRDIQEAVAKALKPRANPDLNAHNLLLRLATTNSGIVKIVTTNFDRLFEDCRPGISTFIPHRLPDPSRPSEFNGIVYLHGKIASSYDKAEGDGFVLSSSEFGKAYLSDGWATSFIRGILDRYHVVFVGYSADDPPIQYLLEALASGPRDGIYAFQSGDENYAKARWEHKGVTPIHYDGTDNHSPLWDTLAAWADRADDPVMWTNAVVQNAKRGPSQLQPYERGQVAHVVSTIEGARRFADGENPPPAEWLCVFDPGMRYAKPTKKGPVLERGPLVNPFDLYSLDSDSVPSKIDPDDHYSRREVPRHAWDAFQINNLDKSGLLDHHTSNLRGPQSLSPPRLPSRQFELSVWLGKIAPEPVALWWALRQSGLHPQTQLLIKHGLDRSKERYPSIIRTGWSYLIESWSENRDDLEANWHEFSARVAKSGWTPLILREFDRNTRPYIKPANNYWIGHIPVVTNDSALHEIIKLDVEYPDIPDDLLIPDLALPNVITILRRNLELASSLETEIGGYGLSDIPSFIDEDENEDISTKRTGLSGSIQHFLVRMERLLSVDAKAAQSEVDKWRNDDDAIFAKLRIWAMGKPTLVNSEEFFQFASQLSHKTFWDAYHARDLLYTLRSRWSQLDPSTQTKIEERLCLGPSRWPNEDEGAYIDRKASAILSRLTWLNEQGCRLSIDLSQLTSELTKQAPKWRPHHAQAVAESLSPKAGWVRTETDHAILETEPLGKILSKSREAIGRDISDFTRYDPFAGLSSKKPVRAFGALRLAAKNGDFPEWAWRAFLNSEQRKIDKPKFTAFIGLQLSRYPAASLKVIIRPIADWIYEIADKWSVEHPDTFNRLMHAIINTLRTNRLIGSSALKRGSDGPDWATEAINSPTGKLAQAVFKAPQIHNLKKSQTIPAEWASVLVEMLSLPGDLKRHAIVILSFHLNWLFFVDPTWTKLNLLSVVESSRELDKQAFWAGFLWRGRATGFQLFQRLKPYMLRLARSPRIDRHGHTETLAGLLLSAWILEDEKKKQRWISNDELRDAILRADDSLRVQMLWLADHWANESPDVWGPGVLRLLQDVWPRQRAAKSAIVSAKLCDIAFSNESRFVSMAAAVEPLLTKADTSRLMLPSLRRSRDNIVDLHPRETLTLIHIILPDQVSAWPYGMDEVITRIGEADTSLNSDARLIELKRRWDAR